MGRRELKTIKGPARFFAQFVGDEPPFNSVEAVGDWTAASGGPGHDH